MSKLSFYLNPSKQSGINFNTRYGASITIYPGQRLEYPLRDEDDLSPEENAKYYNDRYSHYGLITRVINDIVIPVKKPFDRLEETKSEEQINPINTVEQEVEIHSELNSEENKQEVKETPAEENLDSFTYAQLRAKAEELGITLEGRESKVSIKEKILAAGN